MKNFIKKLINEADPAVIYNVETGRMMIIDSHVAYRHEYKKAQEQPIEVVRELAGIRVI